MTTGVSSRKQLPFRAGSAHPFSFPSTRMKLRYTTSRRGVLNTARTTGVPVAKRTPSPSPRLAHGLRGSDAAITTRSSGIPPLALCIARNPHPPTCGRARRPPPILALMAAIIRHSVADLTLLSLPPLPPEPPGWSQTLTPVVGAKTSQTACPRTLAQAGHLLISTFGGSGTPQGLQQTPPQHRGRRSPFTLL